jgi:hypothetical protein
MSTLTQQKNDEDISKCSMYSVSSDDFFRCINRSGASLFKVTPKFKMNMLLLLILLLVVLHYFKVITIPLIGEYIPRTNQVFPANRLRHYF